MTFGETRVNFRILYERKKEDSYLDSTVIIRIEVIVVAFGGILSRRRIFDVLLFAGTYSVGRDRNEAQAADDAD